MRVYNQLKTAFLLDKAFCQVCMEAPAGHIHHRAGRIGERLNDTSQWLAVCCQCHRRIHDDPAWAKAHGFFK